MEYKQNKGFFLSRSARGVELEFVMPRELEGKFFARLYARGTLNDEALGDPARVWAALSPEYGGRPLAAPHQVHGVNIIEASEREALPARSEADGVFIDDGCRVLASLRFADGTPVVIARDGAEPWMIILHSGFKGTLLNISAAALKRFGDGSAGRKIWAWIGPRIGGCCYSRRADDPVTREALAIFSPECAKEMNGLVFFDIGGEIRRQLAACGVPDENIFDFGGCTCCENEIFYSYRAGDQEKRNFLLAGCSTNRENM